MGRRGRDSLGSPDPNQGRAACRSDGWRWRLAVAEGVSSGGGRSQSGPGPMARRSAAAGGCRSVARTAPAAPTALGVSCIVHPLVEQANHPDPADGWRIMLPVWNSGAGSGGSGSGACFSGGGFSCLLFRRRPARMPIRLSGALSPGDSAASGGRGDRPGWIAPAAGSGGAPAARGTARRGAKNRGLRLAVRARFFGSVSDGRVGGKGIAAMVFCGQPADSALPAAICGVSFWASGRLCPAISVSRRPNVPEAIWGACV